MLTPLTLDVASIDVIFKEFPKYNTALVNYFTTFFLPAVYNNKIFMNFISDELKVHGIVITASNKISSKFDEDVCIIIDENIDENRMYIKVMGVNYACVNLLQGLLLSDLKNNDIIKRIKVGKLK